MVNPESLPYLLPYLLPLAAVLVTLAVLFYRAVKAIYGAMSASRERTKRILEVYEKSNVVGCEPRTVGFDVRVSRFPMPPPESRGFLNPDLGEPFEWVADKEG